MPMALPARPDGTDKLICRSRMTGFLFAIFLAAPVAAFANEVCDTLNAQLREPPRVIGNTAEVRFYANALARQNIAIRRIRNDMRSYGCSSDNIVTYGNPNAGICAEIGDALLDAEWERDAIIRDRDEAMATQRDNDPGIRRERILAALDANGCTTASAEPPPVTERDVTIYGTAPRPQNPGLPSYPDPSQQAGLRTLCVKTCDGSFFPIASNASPLDFRGLAEQCRNMCPGTQTELYFHSMTDQETSDMVSAETGKPYKELPTAFAYRNASARQEGCSCNMAAYQEEMKSREAAVTPQAEQPYSSITTITSPPADKITKPIEPETAKVPEQPVAERDYDPHNDRVRVVGPKFLPDETSRIDLKNPALKGIQPQQQ